MASEHRLKIAGEIEQVASVCNWVVQVAEDVGLPVKDVNHLELAVDEAVTNIIEHAYGNGSADKPIEIIIYKDPKRFKVTIVDEGPPFDPLTLDEPDPTASIEDRNIGGWGLFFIKKVMDTVDYRYAANKNHLIMEKHIS